MQHNVFFHKTVDNFFLKQQNKMNYVCAKKQNARVHARFVFCNFQISKFPNFLIS